MGLFQSLQAGKRALLTHQLTMGTIGQNIANVNTPGYSRQRVYTSAAQPIRTAFGMVGTGVEATGIRNVRDLFLGAQLRQENKSLGSWGYKEKILSQIEQMFIEPGEDSLRSHMDAFFNSWSQLNNAPDSITSRNDVVARAVTVAGDFRHLSAQLNALKDSVDRDLSVRIQDVNQFTAEIAQINSEISRSELDGSRANDLRDRRDLLIDNLSFLVDVKVIEDSDGSARVYIGSMVIVDRSRQYELATITENLSTGLKSSLVFKGSSLVIKNSGGELQGLIEMRDRIIPKQLQQLDELARSFAVQVNNIHTTGYGLRSGGSSAAPTGIKFFDAGSVSASTIAVNPEVIKDVSLIAASLSGEPGDGSLALRMSQLRSNKILNAGSLTFNEFYGSLVGSIGVEAKQASQFKSNQELVLQQLINAREQVQGVSLDEEMTHLIQAQHAYQAAARIITAVDQALETVINRMGMVGR